MARPASGKEVLAKAKEALAKARTAEELRQAQAVILPLEFGFSMDQVAAVIGVSRGWACQLRTRYIRSGGAQAETKRQRGGRRRENMSKAEEAVFLAPFLGKAAEGGILVVGEIKRALEQRLGRRSAVFASSPLFLQLSAVSGKNRKVCFGPVKFMESIRRKPNHSRVFIDGDFISGC